MSNQLLTKKNQIKRAVRELNLSSEELIDLQAKYVEVFDEITQEALDFEQEQEDKKQKLREYAKMLEEDGIDINELLDNAVPAKKTKRQPKTVPPKYRLHDEDGKVVEWTGRGRKPRLFQAKLDQGYNLDDFLIPEDE